MKESFDDRRFREVLGHFPTGVVLATAIADDGQPVGMVVGSFTSVSLDPPLVAFLPTRTSGRYAQLRTATSFCVNVLAADQEDLCRFFAARGGGSFDSIHWSPAPSGAPIVQGSVAWIDCQLESETVAGDHYLVMGRVRQLEVMNPVAPLMFFQGGYGRFTSLSLVAPAAPELIAAVRHAEVARPHLEELASRLRLECDAIAGVGADLAFVAAANGADSASSVTLGTRIPLMAPLGEQFVAWLGEDAAQRWIDRSGPHSPAERDAVLARLEKARQRGWSMSRLMDGDESRLHEALRAYADGELTPAQERAIRSTITALSAQYEPVELVPGQEYRLHSLAVPVRVGDEAPMLVLRLTHLPSPASASEVMRWVGELRATADKVAAALARPAAQPSAGPWPDVQSAQLAGAWG